jgi:hypothetical protein
MSAKYSAIRTVLSYTVIPALNLMGLGLEEIARSSNEAFAVSYSAMHGNDTPHSLARWHAAILFSSGYSIVQRQKTCLILSRSCGAAVRVLPCPLCLFHALWFCCRAMTGDG